MAKKKVESKFDKKVFQEAVRSNVRSLFRKKLEEANMQEIDGPRPRQFSD